MRLHDTLKDENYTCDLSHKKAVSHLLTISAYKAVWLLKTAQCIMSSRFKSGTFIAVLFWPNLPRRHFLRPARLSRVRQLVISTCTSPHFFACDFTFLSTGDNVESNIS